MAQDRWRTSLTSGGLGRLGGELGKLPDVRDEFAWSRSGLPPDLWQERQPAPPAMFGEAMGLEPTNLLTARLLEAAQCSVVVAGYGRSHSSAKRPI